MADKSYDAVIVGGGTKSIVTAIYLAKYGGMSVGVFEERRELCGGLTSEQSVVPGFIADHHATLIGDEHYAVVQEDFPDFEDKGGKLIQAPQPFGGIVLEDQSCWTVHNLKSDPNQEQTAKDIAQFSGERDAETYLKLWDAVKPGSDYALAARQEIYNLSPAWDDPGPPSPMEKWVLNYLKQPDCPIDYQWLSYPTFNLLKAFWERPGMAATWMRFLLFWAVMPEGWGPGSTGPLGMFAFVHWGPTCGLIEGGTHNVAHAYQRILFENGGEWFPMSRVDKIIVENGTAKGILLADGTTVEAKKLIVSGVDPQQLCLKMIGKDHLDNNRLRYVENMPRDGIAMCWFTFFLHELPKYKSANFNPCINQTDFVALGSDDLQYLYKEPGYRRLGVVPPVDRMLAFHTNTIVDKMRTPEGKHSVLIDWSAPSATFLSEQEWLDYKRTYPLTILKEWEKYAPNMTMDNVIGIDTQSPYDAAGRGLNYFPNGHPGVVDAILGHEGRFALFKEMVNHRMPIKNLYVCGAWQLPLGAGCWQGYRCYKAIAEDHGLRKPWDEKGRPY